MILTSGIIAIIMKLFHKNTGSFELCGLWAAFSVLLSCFNHKGLHLICIGFMHLPAVLFSIILIRLFLFGNILRDILQDVLFVEVNYVYESFCSEVLPEQLRKTEEIKHGTSIRAMFTYD